MTTARPTLSIITVTLNCASILPRLIESLAAQDDQDFEWVVVDGGSRDETVAVAKSFAGRTQIVSGPDFGIYDALNTGVRMARGDYYLVAGADDQLYASAVTNFRSAAQRTGADILGAKVDCMATTLSPMKGKRWLRGGNALIASHSVGTLIRRQLHEQVGFYSNRYVNCADMYFVLKAAATKSVRIAGEDFVAGRFSAEGVSSADRICSLSDAFRIQLVFGENRLVQFAFYGFRVFRALFLRTQGNSSGARQRADLRRKKPSN